MYKRVKIEMEQGDYPIPQQQQSSRLKSVGGGFTSGLVTALQYSAVAFVVFIILMIRGCAS